MKEHEKDRSGTGGVGSTEVTAEMYDSIYTRRVISNYISHLDNTVIGDKLTKELRCTGFVSKRDPERYRILLKRHMPAPVERSANILDLGCGFGRLGCWLAKELCLNLIGLDFSSVAIKHARLFARSQPRQYRARFKVADFSATGLAAGSACCVVSLDALYLAVDQLKVLREIRRILIPDGPVVTKNSIRAAGL